MKLSNLTILTLNTNALTDYAAARNALRAGVTTEWILYLDTDETISPELEQELRKVLANPTSDAYTIPRRDYFLGRPLRYGETGRASFVRLGRRDWGHWEGRVHETWRGVGRIGSLRYPIIHTPHPTLAGFVSKIDHYSTLAAEERYAKGIKGELWQCAIYPVSKFLVNYFLRLGFLDGTPGLIHAILMSWHSYLTHTKLYLLWHNA